MRAVSFVRRLIAGIVEDGLPDMAAMLAYYAIFALFPMLLVIITIALLAIPPEALQEGVAMASKTLPPEIGRLLGAQVARMQDAAEPGLAIVGAVVAMWGASRGADALGRALNRVHGRIETRPWWKRQLVAIGVTALVAVLVVLALGLLVVGPSLGHAVIDRFGLGAAFDTGWSIGRWVGAGVLMCLVWSLVYKLLPDAGEPFHLFTPGAVVGVLLWLGASQGFAYFLTHFAHYETTYGALAGVIIFMLWLWLSNLVLLIGAEVNDVIVERRDDRARRVDRVTTAPRSAPQPSTRNPVHRPAR